MNRCRIRWAASTVMLLAAASLCRAAELALEGGVAVADITPQPGKMLWGYSNRTHGATGTLDPLMAKAVVLRAGDNTVAIVSLDLGRTPEEAVLAKVRERARAQCGVKNLFVTASHTHHAPVMESTTEKPNPYADQVGETISKIIAAAAGDLVKVRIGVGRGTADFSHNRRKFLPDGRVAMQWRNAEHEPTEPVDRQYATIRIDREDGSVLAVLFHYACHPVVLGPDNYEYSADYVGATSAVVEEALKTKCLFLQGACGNINPYLDKTPLDQGGIAEMRKMGRALGELLVNTARQTTVSAGKIPRLQYEARPIAVRTRWNLDDPEVRQVLSQAYGARFDNYLAKTIKHNQLACTLTTLVINDELALVGMPGEIFVQFQFAIASGSPVANTFLVGYTNGFYGYFPTIRDAAAGGYGGKTATYVEPGAGERLTDEALITLYKMTDQLHDLPRAEDFKLLEYDEVRGRPVNQ
ncbi:MAG TPA: neutral/alkaline non-lysosomal ceramidase N-terminal domain-containing protein [Pirellulales bacterium]|nr:neutral/alkaline non-lysosomal ceramidase N-terminal domain-containing protein [Pirellulales bacterium]